MSFKVTIIVELTYERLPTIVILHSLINFSFVLFFPVFSRFPGGNLTFFPVSRGKPKRGGNEQP